MLHDGDSWLVDTDLFNQSPLANSNLAVVPKNFKLEAPYPNPFNPIITIEYSLPYASNVLLVIYDLNGRQVDILYNGIQQPNNYTIYGISGALDFRSKSFDECLNKKKDIEKEIEAIFQDSQKKDHGIYLTPDYTDNKSKRSQVEYILKGSEEIISVECVNWSEKTEKKQDWGDNLSITLYSKEYEEFARGL